MKDKHQYKQEDCFWQTDQSTRFAAQIDFLIEADKVKKIFRQTRLVHDQRYENDSEHAWHFALYAMVLAEYADDGIDLLKVLRMALIHDLVEIDAGDVVLYDKAAREAVEEKERAAAERIFGLLPDDQAGDFRGLWDEFEARETPEARFAAALDRVQPLMNNYMTQGYTWKKHNITYDMVIEANGHIARSSTELWNFILAMLDRAVEKGYLKKN